jgi:putative heme-binding domain-containing protein
VGSKPQRQHNPNKNITKMKLSIFFRVWTILLSAAVCHSTSISSAQTDHSQIRTPAGFKAELVYSIPPSEGSWVSLTNEKNGRMIASDQNGALYRITPPFAASTEAAGENGSPSATADPPVIERIDVKLGFAQGLLYAFDSLYVVAHGNDRFKTPAGLFRVRDTDGDDQYETVELLRQFEGGGEHGPHAVILSPDGQSLYICAGNHTKPPKPEFLRMSERWDEDQLLRRHPDANGHAVGIMAPGGWICKTDPDGSQFEMIAAGFRNQYDIAFDPNGELFTYDADMEWDIGLPWYRPTRVCHAVSGSEFGWRHGSGKWPENYCDGLPGAVDVGPGSPTGIVFGTGAKFPAAYQHALFIADWSYGIIYAVRFSPEGSTYLAALERFCAAPALPVTDMVINPADGAMYFLIGGRGLRSALYRVSYHGTESTAPAPYPELTPAALARQELESWHEENSEPDFEKVWNCLRSEDRFLRFAARVVLERQPLARWLEQLQREAYPQAILEGVVALARTNSAEHQSVAVALLSKLNWDQLSLSQRLNLCRAYGLTLIRLAGLGDDQRHPNKDAKLLPATSQTIANLESCFPSGDEFLDRELAKLLVAVESPTITAKMVDQLLRAATQEHQIAYAFILAESREGWNQSLRESYFQWFLDAAKNQGGHSLSGYVGNLRRSVIEQLNGEEREALANILQKEPATKDPYADLAARPLVNKWTMKDLLDFSDQSFGNANLENGKKLFGVAACYKCHRLQGSGGIVGPDLTIAGHRFSTLDLLETIVEPSKAISDQYEATMFLLADGRVIVGRVANLSGNQYMVQEDLITPGKFTHINASEIEEMKPSKVSLMPEGLLDTLTREEIIDLIGYMKSVAGSGLEKKAQ